MKTIRVKKPPIEYKDECGAVQDALIKKGYYATLEQCDEMWRKYSEDEHCAGWVTVGSYTDAEIYKYLRSYFEEWPVGSVDTKYI
jgi:hypothetical protein